ncbi:PIG-L family deacetylase [Aetokthonos hydrillicola Thurmond2011]|jgi:LmbE family N-acetylglucosaminyl deacetylase|uniref:PIG-L family deacetylase n=1 Tax=Aetokthonos hydrillicola Thurmond2011 TaxID=2712845 RepID=A0AAP5MBD4_9CYAN|nr:PIG-L family deacetylase [Aetokthonos hydrillicola]MBO3461300.1 PIG-L family deacetylase [Aetokthonos hydrillicola CCALA 1050]MBW4589638.1 PIG-L family deacetylase [Aetokthonos hydrillicola CCALA 1050]MDR9899135.1 PIG-L family deacetylase [Aetokthonos hydrillicola Thurmond2011]
MNTKQILQKIQTLIPHTWLYQLQEIHSSLLFRWILHRGSKSLTFSQKSMMVFSPHQDDETFGCGGMIALKREQGIPVAVTFLTDGQGFGGSDAQTKNEIVEIRKQEAVKALQILGVEQSRIHFLEKPDGTLQDLEPRQRQQTIEQLAELISFYKPEEIYVPHRKDCHKDHEATYELVKEAIRDEKTQNLYKQAGIEVELVQYPIWLFWRSPLFIMLKLEDIATGYRFSIASVQDKKNKAIASYRSQIESLPHGFVKRFLGSYEIFFKTEEF